MTVLSYSQEHVPPLPLELLMEIFNLATYNSTREIDRLVDLPPFETLYIEKQQEQDQAALRTKYALALTCSLFNKMTTRFLYEDLWISRGSTALLSSLRSSKSSSAKGESPGDFVKRVTLLPTPTSFSIDDALQILSLCPKVRMVSYASALYNAKCNRTGKSGNEFPRVALNDLPANIEPDRLDWHNSISDELVAMGVSSGLTWHSPSIRVLTVGSDNVPVPRPDDRANEEPEVLINLPQLHTLRLRSFDALGDPDETWYSVQFPSLRRIVLERPLSLYALHVGCLAFYGTRITTLELGRHPRFLRIDALSIALGYCPNTETLLFPIFTTMPPAKNPFERPRSEWIEYRVKRIGLSASIEDDCDYQVSKTWMWVQLTDLVDALFGQGTRFSALECITFHGNEWRELAQDDTFRAIVNSIKGRKLKIDCEDSVTADMIARFL